MERIPDDHEGILHLLYLALDTLRNIGECPNCGSCKDLANGSRATLTLHAETMVEKFKAAVKELDNK